MSLGPSDPFGRTETSVVSALRFDLFLMALFCALALGGTAAMLVREERRKLADPVEQGVRGEVVGVTGLSLAAPENLGRALREMEAAFESDEQVTNFRLAPTRLDVIVRNTFGRQRVLQLRLDHEVRVLSDTGTNSSTGPRTLRAIDPAAPARMIRAVLAREGWSPATLDYLVFDFPDGDTASGWDAFFVQVPIERNHYTADGAGNGAHRPGEPVP